MDFACLYLRRKKVGIKDSTSLSLYSKYIFVFCVSVEFKGKATVSIRKHFVASTVLGVT